MSENIGAIDIGSNAIRLVIGRLEEKGRLCIVKKIREPVRLGHDVFLDGTITDKTSAKAIKAFDKFKDNLKKFSVTHCRAVATSAVREAKNKADFIQRVQKETGIKIQIIDGIEEAKLIHLAVSRELDLNKKRAMLIDIGGGSVEVTFSNSGQMMATESFRMGTVRLLEKLQKNKWGEQHLNLLIGEFVQSLSRYIETESHGQHLAFAVGTGGNLECLGRLKVQLLNKTPNTFLTAEELGEIINKLRGITLSERINKLDMRPDRADVIVPAAMVVQTIMRQAACEKLMIPYVGLKDGLLWKVSGLT